MYNYVFTYVCAMYIRELQQTSMYMRNSSALFLELIFANISRKTNSWFDKFAHCMLDSMHKDQYLKDLAHVSCSNSVC